MGGLLGWYHSAGRRLRDWQGRACTGSRPTGRRTFSPVTAGSLWIPDTSTYEHNDPAQPWTGGGHNWVFDQGSTLCKVTDVGRAGAVATGWEIPPNNTTDCVILPIIKNGTVTNLGDIPYQGSVVTPTCNPSHPEHRDRAQSRQQLPQPAWLLDLPWGGRRRQRTRRLSCSWLASRAGYSRSSSTTSPTRQRAARPARRSEPQNYYSAIPENSLLTSAAVSPNGRFVIATSMKRLQAVYACFNPLGDPGDITKPINPRFFVPPASMVPCMQVGTNNMPANLTTTFGPDSQPYFGGRRVVMSFDSQPGGPFKSAWPNCIYQNSGLVGTTLQQAFANPLAFTNGCGPAQPNSAYTSALITQPAAMITHNNYMYSGPVGGTIIQFKVTQDPFSGISQYKFRTLVSGLSIVTGLGIAGDQHSLMIYTDPTAIGLAAQEIVTKVPLCEDM